MQESGCLYSAAILAGGRATRFGGRDKSALVVSGHTILERQIAELSQISSDVMIVGGAPSEVPAGVRHVADRVVGCGPLGGLHAALTEARGTATAIVACDMPYISAQLLRYLLALTTDADLVIPRTERGYHPLCAAYTRACLEPITRRLADGRLKLTGLLDDVRVRVVDDEALEAFGDPERQLANVNTPDEYRSTGSNNVQS
jgi:molybdopterin-guanine dinucleotide biosynthesis protein A